MTVCLALAWREKEMTCAYLRTTVMIMDALPPQRLEKSDRGLLGPRLVTATHKFTCESFNNWQPAAHPGSRNLNLYGSCLSHLTI